MGFGKFFGRKPQPEGEMSPGLNMDVGRIETSDSKAKRDAIDAVKNINSEIITLDILQQAKQDGEINTPLVGVLVSEYAQKMEEQFEAIFTEAEMTELVTHIKSRIDANLKQDNKSVSTELDFAGLFNTAARQGIEKIYKRKEAQEINALHQIINTDGYQENPGQFARDVEANKRGNKVA